MGRLLLLLLQVGTEAAAPASPVTIPTFVDPVPSRACPPGAAGEIVVCAKPVDPAKYRLQPGPGPSADEALPRAEVKLFGDAKAAASVQAVGQYQAPAAMVTITIPF